MKVMFYLSPQTHIPTQAAYEHPAVCIAEGLKQLGISFYANVYQWFDNEEKDYLFKPVVEGFDPDVCIYSASYYINKLGNVRELDPKKYNILLDLEDGYPTLSNDPAFVTFNLVLRTHYSTDYSYNKNVIPWAFGVSNRIMHELDKTISSKDGHDVYVNYRVGFNTRSMSIQEMLPVLAEKYAINHSVTDSIDIKTMSEDVNDYWNQTGRRHNPRYYEQLNKSLLTLAFCGAFEQKTPRLFYRIKETIEKRTFRTSKNFTVANFDSWRFWESMYSNTCPVHLDFEYWNLKFPVQPVEGKHFIGVGNLNFREVAQQINNMQAEQIRQIGFEGRNFMKENYTPLPTANRLLSLIN